MSADPQSAIQSGHYFRKQLGCSSRLIAWSHRSRFEHAAALTRGAGEKLLDYGCGDGTFLGMVAQNFRECTGADLAADQVRDCALRLRALSNTRFVETRALAERQYDCGFDVITCMEVLEHCLDPIVDEVLQDLARLLAPRGRLIVSVPIETGPAFIAKFLLRKIAGWRNLGDYRYSEAYSFRDAARMIFAREHDQIQRKVHGEGDCAFHGHHGFNWQRLRAQLSTRFEINSVQFTPLGWSGGMFSSQAWFVCGHQAGPPRL